MSPLPATYPWPSPCSATEAPASLLALAASSDPFVAGQALYLVTAAAVLKSYGHQALEFQSPVPSPQGHVTVPCVLQKGEEMAVVYSHAREWREDDVQACSGWCQKVRSHPNLGRITIVVLSPFEPLQLLAEGRGPETGVIWASVSLDRKPATAEPGVVGFKDAAFRRLPVTTLFEAVPDAQVSLWLAGEDGGDAQGFIRHMLTQRFLWGGEAGLAESRRRLQVLFGEPNPGDGGHAFSYVLQATLGSGRVIHFEVSDIVNPLLGTDQVGLYWEYSTSAAAERREVARLFFELLHRPD